MLNHFNHGLPYLSYSSYIVAITIEYLSNHPKKQNIYSIKDSLVNLSTGLFALFLPYILNLSILSCLYKLLNPFAIMNLSGAWVNIFQGEKFYFWIFFFLIILDDLTYYWYHRVSHTSRFFWCIHEVHHSSEKFNFTVYFRASFLEYFVSGIFWIPMILIGFKLEDIIFQIGISLFYQFWLHNSHTKRIPVFDYVFNTPSHHRVHHSQNIPYLDKNFGAIFIIWDRLFHTFAKEENELKFGVLSPPKTYNPLIVYLHTFKALWADVKSCPFFMDKIKYIIYPPGWRHDGTGATSKQLQINFKSEK